MIRTLIKIVLFGCSCFIYGAQIEEDYSGGRDYAEWVKEEEQKREQERQAIINDLMPAEGPSFKDLYDRYIYWYYIKPEEDTLWGKDVTDFVLSKEGVARKGAGRITGKKTKRKKKAKTFNPQKKFHGDTGQVSIKRARKIAETDEAFLKKETLRKSQLVLKKSVIIKEEQENRKKYYTQEEIDTFTDPVLEQEIELWYVWLP